MRVGLYQNHPVFGAVDRNVQEVFEALTPIRAELVVLPESFATGYQFVSSKRWRPWRKRCLPARPEPDDGPGRETGMTLVFGIAERQGSQVFNSAAVVSGHGFWCLPKDPFVRRGKEVV